MKKLFLLAILLLSVTSASAQLKQFRVIYTETFVPTEGEEVTWKKNQTTMFFNYNGEPKIKMYAPNSTVIIYAMISKVDRGQTEDGTKYSGATYVDKDGEEVYIQYFDEQKYGTRFVFSDATSMEFR